MSGSLRWRVGAVAAVILLFTFVTVANFIPKEQRVSSGWLPDDGLRWGLDLQGGFHWVVGVEIGAAMEHELEFQRSNLVEILADDDVVPASALVVDGRLLLEASSEEDLAKIRSAATDSGVLAAEPEGELSVAYGLTDDWSQEIRERTMLQVLEVLRRRIDDPERGIPDSVVTRQGRDRVLVQIPGGQIDRGRARDLLKSTGFLEFKIVIDSAANEEALLAGFPDGLPEGQEILFEVDSETQAVVGAYLVKIAPDLTGDYLDDARVGFDQQQRPIVNFQFNPEGGRKFGDLTEASVGERLAIILDHQIYSAPVIRNRISSRGQITGRFSSQEAADLAVVLRAGSLSVPVIIEEERTVGPALGQDSIDRGLRASLVGLVLILTFGIFYYRLSGVYASFALVTNLVMLIGLMSLFEATLTLPGIAGLVLTVGMAVDANVIIFERIREELRSGKTVRAGIATGFSKATWTVLDANITTLITALVLFEFGTGPIKGFAVTLSVGILTSVFSALVVTRLLFQLYPGTKRVAELSI
ncbi:MAG: protein translocase subunit SecD [Deltaproteobacteria bacterium]|nr:protein translocase subunit SecD [Deltaproteobacteria bacterium]